MSDGQTKQRFSARVTTETLDELETYQHQNDLDNRSAAIEHLVEYRNQVERQTAKWELLAQQALYAVTFSLIVAVISGVSFVAAVILSSYPSVWTVISISVMLGGVLAAVGSAAAYQYSSAKATVDAVEVDT